MTNMSSTPAGWFGFLGPCVVHRPDEPPRSEAEIWDDADVPCEDCDLRLVLDMERFDVVADQESCWQERLFDLAVEASHAVEDVLLLGGGLGFSEDPSVS
jgi:hypothetical protein